MRRTKIVCTLGPATSSEKMITKLINAGMDVARLNFSHGSYEDHKNVIEIIRKISTKLKKSITILQDLQGPKLRIGNVINDKIYLEKGRKISITTDDVLGDTELISTSYKHLPQDVTSGDKILLDDGLIQLKVEKTKDNKILCEINNKTWTFASKHRRCSKPKAKILLISNQSSGASFELNSHE